MANTDNMEALEPSGSGATYRGEDFDIKPIPVGKVPALVRTARPVIDSILSLDKLPEDDTGELVTLLLDLIEKHGEAVFAAAAICTGKKQDWLEGGDIDEFIVLAKKIVEVNRDFFVQRLAPRLGGRAAAMESQMSPGPGPTPSSS